jgi:hypothetical protein
VAQPGSAASTAANDSLIGYRLPVLSAFETVVGGWVDLAPDVKPEASSPWREPSLAGLGIDPTNGIREYQ